MFEMFRIDQGHEWSIGTAAALEDAREKVFALAEFWPAEYAILDKESGNWSRFPANRWEEQADLPDEAWPELIGPPRKEKAAA